MTWVRNIEGRHYRYRSKRVNGKVKSIYEGKSSGEAYTTYKDQYKRPESFGDRRSAHARRVDMATKAEIVLEPTKANITLWKKHKDIYDLKGYDTPTIKTRTSALVTEILRIKTSPKPKHKHIEGTRMSGVELENLYKIADKFSVARDIVDWHSLIDRKLDYHENYTQLEKFISQMGIKSEDQLIQQYKYYRQELTEREKEHLKEHTVTVPEFAQYRDKIMTALKVEQPVDFYTLQYKTGITNDNELSGTIEQMIKAADILQNQRGDYLLL